jgi:hypothetical protein
MTMQDDIEVLQRILSEPGKWLIVVHLGHIVKVAIEFAAGTDHQVITHPSNTRRLGCRRWERVNQRSQARRAGPPTGPHLEPGRSSGWQRTPNRSLGRP